MVWQPQVSSSSRRTRGGKRRVSEHQTAIAIESEIVPICKVSVLALACALARRRLRCKFRGRMGAPGPEVHQAARPCAVCGPTLHPRYPRLGFGVLLLLPDRATSGQWLEATGVRRMLVFEEPPLAGGLASSGGGGRKLPPRAVEFQTLRAEPTQKKRRGGKEVQIREAAGGT